MWYGNACQKVFPCNSPVCRIFGPVRRDLGFVLVTDGQQFVLGHDLLAAILEVVFEDAVSTMESTGQDSSQKPQ
jgi:hypothetical protein